MPGSAGGGGGYGFDLGDLFGSSSGGTGGRLGDLFGGVFGRGGSTTQQARPRRGTDVETETSLTFSDAIEGSTVSLGLTGEGPCKVCMGTGAKAGTVPRVCPTCEGTGQGSRNLGSFAFSEPCKTCRGRGLVVDDPCPTCSGSGRAMSTRTIQARIPAGVADGQRIKIAGKGAPGERGGPPGDLYVRVHVEPHKVFGRSGHNLTLAVPLTFAEAALGAEIKVPTLNGMPVSLRIPAGTPNGRTFRVRGKGVRRKDSTTGDLLVTVNVQVPSALTDKARSALETFREATAGPDPRGELLRQANG
jgi:molecular chaperone DnaJ